MAVGDWQPGKIVVLWAVTLACYPVLRAMMPTEWGQYPAAAHLIVWFLVVLAAATITWVWLTERGKSK